MTALIALLSGAAAGYWGKKYVRVLVVLLVVLCIILLSLSLSISFISDRVIRHQEHLILKDLHAEYETMERFTEYLLKQDLKEADDIHTVARESDFNGWYMLVDSSGYPSVWNHHILDYPYFEVPTTLWTLDGWVVTRTIDLKAGFCTMALHQEHIRPVSGIQEVVFRPSRQFAPLPRNTQIIESTLIWKEENLPPFLQVQIRTDPLQHIRRSFYKWEYGILILFAAGFFLVRYTSLTTLYPLILRILLIPVPWHLVGIRSPMADSSCFGIHYFNPLFCNLWEASLTLLAVSLTIFLSREIIQKRVGRMVALLIPLSFILAATLSIFIAPNISGQHSVILFWTAVKILFLLSFFITACPSKSHSLTGNTLVLITIMAGCFIREWWLLIILLMILSLAVTFRRLSAPVTAVLLLFLAYQPLYVARRGTWEQHVERHVSRQIINQSVSQLAFLNGPVSHFFSNCDLTFLFPHAAYVHDWQRLATILADESGLLEKGMLVAVEVFHEDEKVSVFSNFPIPQVRLSSEGTWQVTEEQVFGDVHPIYYTGFPLFMEQQAWGRVELRIMVNDPRIPPFVHPWRGRVSLKTPFAVFDPDGESIFSSVGEFPQYLGPDIRRGENRWIRTAGDRHFYRMKDGNTCYLFALPVSVTYYPYPVFGLLFLTVSLAWIFRRRFPARSLVRALSFWSLGGILFLFLTVILLVSVAIRQTTRDFRHQGFMQKADQLGRMVVQLQREEALEDPQIGYFLSRLAGSHVLVYDHDNLTFSTLPGIEQSEPFLKRIRPDLLQDIKMNGWLRYGGKDETCFYISLPHSDMIIAFLQADLVSTSRLPAWFNLLSGAALFLFGILLLIVVSTARRITRPLEELTESARAVMAGGPFSPPAVRHVYEVDTLTDALALMVDTLQREKEAFATLVENLPAGIALLDSGQQPVITNRAFDSICRDLPIQTILRGEDKIDHGEKVWSLQKVELSDDRILLVMDDVTEIMRSERYEAWFSMARIIAHEIKNPLTPLKLTLEYMAEKQSKDVEEFNRELPELIREMLRQMEELNRISVEFSDFAKITQLKLEPQDLPVCLHEWLQPYLHLQNVSCHIPEVKIQVMCDRRLFRRAVINIVNNALQSSFPPPELLIQVSVERTEARISFTDMGPGVPEEQLSHIFEPYFSTKVGGSGLGLSIAHKIAVEHGGTATAFNRPEGGLTVILTLPIIPNA